MSIQLDAIDADAFENSGSVDDDSALLLARISTTPNRLRNLFDLDTIREGDWLKIEIEQRSQRPRTWLLPFANGYEQLGPPLNAVAVNQLPDTDEVVTRLEKSCARHGVQQLADLGSLAGLFRGDRLSKLRVSALDVGQAACVAFFDSGSCFGYFDVGAPLFFNKRSFPRNFHHSIASRGFVILSHWDFDHYALAYRYPELKNLDWYAPQQPIGPNAARFQRSLGPRLNFISGDHDFGHLLLGRCNGTSMRDRNATGYVARVQMPDAGILLTGDADYEWIPKKMVVDANRLVVPHHGGSGSSPPSPGRGLKPLAVCSYGLPNSYRHPDEKQLKLHNKAGWPVRRTAAFGTPPIPRGDRRLYPI